VGCSGEKDYKWNRSVESVTNTIKIVCLSFTFHESCHSRLGAGIVEFEEDFQVENKIKDV
jgi:hypothetical protein